MMDHPTLLAAIGRALGQDGPYRESSGDRQEEINIMTGWMPPKDRSRRVLGGAVDEGGRVAWIEEEVYGSEEVDQPALVNDPETGELVETTYRETWVHSSIHLRAANGGQEHLLGKDLDDKPAVGLDVPSYNPYFGCHVGFMEWRGDVLVTLYHEKHETIAWAVPLHGEPSLVTITSAAVVRGDELYFQGEEPGILIGLSLPDFSPLVPIPTASTVDGPSIRREDDIVVISRPGWREEREDDIEVERVKLPPRGAKLDSALAEQIVPRAIEALLGPNPPQPSADIIAGAVLSPLYAPQTRLRRSYHEGYQHWFTPHWLPAYWHRFLTREGRTTEAEAHLALLDALAATPVPAIEEPLLAAATRHVIQRAKVLAEVCRARKLPEQWGCPFWPRTDNVFRKEPPGGAPRGLVEAMGIMASRPPSIGTYYRPAEDD